MLSRDWLEPRIESHPHGSQTDNSPDAQKRHISAVTNAETVLKDWESWLVCTVGNQIEGIQAYNSSDKSCVLPVVAFLQVLARYATGTSLVVCCTAFIVGCFKLVIAPVLHTNDPARRYKGGIE